MRVLGLSLVFFVWQVEVKAVEISSLPRGRVVMETADWCDSCQWFEREVIPALRRDGWKVGTEEGNHLRIRRVQSGTVPRFVITREGTIVASHVGVLNHRQFVNWVRSHFEIVSVESTEVTSENWNYQNESVLN